MNAKEAQAVSAEKAETEVLLTIEETPLTRKARSYFWMNDLAGPLEVGLESALLGVLLRPLAVRCYLRRPLWTREHAAWVACEALALVAVIVVGQWALWWRHWRGVPYRWEFTATGIHRAGRPWMRRQEVRSLRVTRVMRGQTVKWCALGIRPVKWCRNLFFGTPYIPFDPRTVPQEGIASVCQQFVPVEPTADLIGWAPPWLASVALLAFLLLGAALVWLVVRRSHQLG